MSQVQRPFDPDDKKYMCICGCHVMTGSKIVAYLGTFSITLCIIYFIRMIAENENKYNSSYELLLFVVIGWSLLLGLASNISLWYGLIKERERYLLPTIVIMIIGLLLYGFISWLVMNGNTSINITVPFLCNIPWFFSFVLYYWFIRIINSAYSYIKDKRAATGGIAVVQQVDRVHISVLNSNPAPLPNGDSAPPPYEDLAPPSYDDCINVR